MAGESAARRYARAAFELALEKGQPLEAWLSDLDAVAAALSDPQAMRVLTSPKLSFEQKRSIVDAVTVGIDPLRRNFLYLLVDRGRIEMIDMIRREFRAMMLEHQGIAEATVTTAVPISDAEATRVANLLGNLIGKTVLLERKVDPSIIGGLVARVGDKLINASVAARLEALREQMV
jgi:F-type H+-transporting ATPase subunit delta